MEGFTPYASLAGGILIGVAAILLLLFVGRIAGASGILAGVLWPTPNDTAWRVVWLAGLLLGALSLHWIYPSAMQVEMIPPMPLVIAGGLLVGMGTRIGKGCTSGHGVCGIGRLAPRSMVASAVFVVAAFATANLSGVLQGL